MSDEQLAEMLSMGDARYSEPVQAARAELRRRSVSKEQIARLEAEARQAAAEKAPRAIKTAGNVIYCGECGAGMQPTEQACAHW